MSNGDPVVLGQRYRDPVSGWERIATAFHSYMFGCRRVTISGVDGDGKPDEYSFDEPQLELAKGRYFPISQDKRETGGPRGTTRGQP